jgi:hypothetical protein
MYRRCIGALYNRAAGGGKVVAEFAEIRLAILRIARTLEWRHATVESTEER